jgi:hypothetical protein
MSFEYPRAFKLLALSLVCLVTPIATPLFAAAVQLRTPQSITDPRVEYPIWVSAELLDSTAGLSAGLLHSLAAERISGIFERTPVHGCYPDGPMIVDYYGGKAAPTSLEEAARNYSVIAFGTVKELTPGFRLGEPGNMVRAEADDGSRGIAPGTPFYVFVPIGDVEVFGKRVCKQDPRYAGLPKIGDQVLVFADPPFSTQQPLYFTLRYPQDFVLISDDSVRLSPDLVRSAITPEALPTTKDELVTTLPLLPAPSVER